MTSGVVTLSTAPNSNHVSASSGNEPSILVTEPELAQLCKKHPVEAPTFCLSVGLVVLYHVFAAEQFSFQLDERVSSITSPSLGGTTEIDADVHGITNIGRLFALAETYRRSTGIPQHDEQHFASTQLTLSIRYSEERQIVFLFIISSDDCWLLSSSNQEALPRLKDIGFLFTSISKQIIDDPSQSIFDIDFTGTHRSSGPGEKEEVMASHCIHTLVLQACEKYAEKTAIDSYDSELSYRDLDGLSLAWARRLVHSLEAPRRSVLLCMEQTQEAVIIWLGIMRSGSVCVPVDTRASLSTMQSIWTQTNAGLLICDNQRAALFRKHLTIMTPESAPAFQPMFPNPPDAKPADDAIVMFTSGSTGAPKGVIQTHGAVSRSLVQVAATLKVDENTRFLQFAALSFDASIFEIFGPLVVGGCVCIPRTSDKIIRITEVINEMRVNFATLTPAIAQLINVERLGASLKTLCLGGAPPSKDLCARWADRLELHVIYGCTEGAVWDTCSRIDKSDCEQGLIGFPIQDPVLIQHPVNPALACLPGVAGEICLTGPSLARGYLGLPKLTAERFRTLPESSIKIYRTGDRGKVCADDSLHYIGRMDRQVKIDGQRLELGDVEAKLRCFLSPELHSLVELVEFNHVEQLVAFASKGEVGQSPVTALPEVDAEIKSSLSAMRSQCPAYMCPRHAIMFSSFPLTRTGKIDRHELIKLARDFFASCKPSVQTPGGPQSESRNPDNLISKINRCLGAYFQSIRGPGAAVPQNSDSDLSRFGITSIDAASMSHTLRKELQLTVPACVLLRQGLRTQDIKDFVLRPQGDEHDEAHKCLLKRLQTWTAKFQSIDRQVIFLTGATGYLGREILKQILAHPQVKKVIVLVRGHNLAAGHDKLISACSRTDWWDESCSERIEVWLGDLTQRRLGLSVLNWTRLFGIGNITRDVNMIIHNGATVNWALQYTTLEDVNVGSTYEILRGACQTTDPPRFVFVSGGYMSLGPEAQSDLAMILSDMPAYDQTKFICESMIQQYNKRMNETKAIIVKPGFIVGSAADGIAQQGDVLWRLIKTCVKMGFMSALDARQWIPVAGVDSVASLTIFAALEDDHSFCKEGLMTLDSGLYMGEFVPILATQGLKVDLLDHDQWFQRLFQQLELEGIEHPLHPVKDWLAAFNGCIGVEEAPRHSGFDALVRPREAVESSISRLQAQGFWN